MLPAIHEQADAPPLVFVDEHVGWDVRLITILQAHGVAFHVEQHGNSKAG